MPEVVYNVDLLFHTLETDQPGSMHVKVMAPRVEKKLTIVIEVDPFTSIKNNIDSILTDMQKDIFNRIDTDARREANVILEVKEHVEEFPGCEYVKLAYDGEGYSYEKVDKIVY
jgi:hypothetical protein